MNLETLRSQHKDAILRLAEESGISNIRVFGSVALGEADEDSDVDFLVTVEKGAGLRFYGFCADLEDILHRDVDVLSDRAVNKYMLKRVFDEATPL